MENSSVFCVITQSKVLTDVSGLFSSSRVQLSLSLKTTKVLRPEILQRPDDFVSLRAT
jgi:hypothetical protein